MPTDTRPKPVTFCTVCGRVGYNIATANQRCGQTFNRKRCRGVNTSALNVNDWSECPSCAATGGENGKTCHQCDGAGWLARRRF